MISYVTGDATVPRGIGPRIIAHVCNDRGSWGRGFVVAVSRRWTAPEAAYRAWYQERKTNGFRLGAVQLVPVGDSIVVANMIGQWELVEPPPASSYRVRLPGSRMFRAACGRRVEGVPCSI